MKIGIVTIHRATNYGAVLQAYALKKVLEKKGNQVDFVDYRCKHIEDLYVNKFADFIALKTKVKNVLTWDIQLKRNQKFEPFIKKQLGCSEETSKYTKEELEKLNEEYDCFISGSDQIFNPFCTGDDLRYFLDFVDDEKKKYSYAASFGNIKQEFIENPEYQHLLGEFQGLSVREEKGKLAVEEMIHKEALVHLDPTFLLEKKDWEELVLPVKESNYVLVYSLSMPKTLENMARAYAKENQKMIRFITLNNLFAKTHKEEVVNCSPEEFVSYFYHADCIFTNSFHGTAFSIMFHKEFFVEKNANPNHDNSRLENVLGLFGLEHRMVSEVPKKQEIDYIPVTQKHEKMRQASFHYLDAIGSF